MTARSRLSETAIGSRTQSEALRPLLIPVRYSRTAIAFHWVLAAMIFALFGIGVYIANIPRSLQRQELIGWHQWAGMVFLTLTVVRIAWRLTHRPPALPASIARAMPAWQHGVHRATQRALYVMFLAVPLLGWLYSSAAGLHVVLFGVFPVPDLVQPNKTLAELLIHLHGPSGLVLMILALVHIAGALKHHWLDRDGLIRRMLPIRGW